MIVYDNSTWKKQSGLPRRFQIPTSKCYNDKKMLEIADAAEAAHGIVHIDLERVPWLEERFGRRLTDSELLAEGSLRAEWLAHRRPHLRIGIWIEQAVDPGVYYFDNLQGVYCPSGLPRHGPQISCDFFGLPAFYHGGKPLDKWLSWRPAQIHKFRLRCRTRLIASMATTYFSGERAGQLQSYDDLRRIYDAIADDVNGVTWFGGNDEPYDPNIMPWRLLTDEIQAEAVAAERKESK